ncbi:tetratricopeptide repeat protein [Streptomyces viridosporus]|uniref:tetratricopeptide repeat protein n=1 Tax=Streptomyces viridosporus TaxID=67581 RepID=UPI003703509D
MLVHWVLVAALAVFLGAVVWAVARFGLEAADQTASVVGGTVALLSLPISLYALRAPGGTEAGSVNGGVAAREWVPAAAVDASLRPPVLSARVRGRDSELALLNRIARDGGGMAVVCGAGGLGKTTLAAQAARQAQQARRAVFWVRWQNDPGRLAEDLTRVAQDLGLAEERLEAARRGQAVLVDVVWEHLAAVPGWVLVVDNVDTPARVGPGREAVASYRGWLRPDGAGLLVVTSRDTAVGTWGRRAQLVYLEPLEETAAAAVLTDAAPAAGSEAEARALAVRLGGLPLALEAAGRYLATATSRYRSFTAYREALDREFGDLLGAEHPQAADPEIARTVVRHTWDLSLTQLHTDGYTLARPLLHLLALLEAAPVPRSLITPALLADAIGQDVTATALDAALAGLHRYALLGVPRTTTADASAGDGAALGVGQLVLHPVVREVMALTPTGTDPAPWYTALDAHLAQAVQDTVHAGRAGWPTARLLAPHLPPLLDRATDPTFTAARGTLDSLAGVLREADASAEEHLLRQHVLNAVTRRLGAEHPDALPSRNNLAVALVGLARYQEAADLFRRVLTDRERALGPDHPDTLASRSSLAFALIGLGQHQEAVDLYSHVRADHFDVPARYSNLAIALVGLGRYEEAADLHRRFHAEHERTLGPDHPATLASGNNLANTLFGLGRHQEAADLHRRVLTDRERLLGPGHSDSLGSRNNLAHVLTALGQHQEASDLHRRVLTDRERTLGPDHPDTLTSRTNLATTLIALGQYQEAAELHQRALTDRERTLGPDHPDTLTSRTNLATTLFRLGQYQEAADLHRRTLADRERTLGPDHPDTLASRNNLAAALVRLGQYQQAADLFRRVLTDRERTLGPDHPDTLASRNNLAAALVGLGQYQEAIDLHRRTLADRERTLGPDHPHTLRSQENLANAEAAAAQAERGWWPRLRRRGRP